MKPFPGKPPRATQECAIYFLTFCTLRRQPILHHPGVPQFLIEELYFYSKRIHHLVAYTIMPDHIHLLVEIDTIQSLSAFLRDFKKFTSIDIARRLRESSVEANHQIRHPVSRSDDRQLQRIWQPGTMDYCIRMQEGSKDYENHISYLFYNSQKHLGIAPKHFPYHNFTEFVSQGYFDEDFCSVSEGVAKSVELYE